MSQEINDELELIRVVLRGYDPSMARDDALRATARVKRLVGQDRARRGEPYAWVPPERDGEFHHEHESITAHRIPMAGWMPVYLAPQPSQLERQPDAECVVCVRCGEENWIQEGVAPCNVAPPKDQPERKPQGCPLGCATECKAKAHGCASECPALPWQPSQPERKLEGDIPPPCPISDLSNVATSNYAFGWNAYRDALLRAQRGDPDDDHCPECGNKWMDHDFGIPKPSCPPVQPSQERKPVPMPVSAINAIYGITEKP